MQPRKIKRNMQSLISRGKAFLTPSQSSTNIHKQAGTFQKAKTPAHLFPAVDPTIDGDECLHDCSSCTLSLPRKWEIDEEDTLYGHVKGWDTHLVVATGNTDWVRDIVDEKGSLMEKIGEHGVEVSNGKVMLSASDMPTGSDTHVDSNGRTIYDKEGTTRCLVLPKWRMVEGVGRGEVDWLMDEVVGKGASNISPLKFKQSEPEKVTPEPQGNDSNLETPTETKRGDETPDLSDLTISSPTPATQSTQLQSTNGTLPTTTIPSSIKIEPCPHRAIILMCSHKTRDWRCGASAPLLRREFERHLRPLGLYRDIHDERPGGVGVYFINHVGGHKYSANVMIYRREGSKRIPFSKENDNDEGEGELSDEAVQGIWLARVRPEDCENIVRYTVLQGKLVKPQRQLRGGFDRDSGLVSW